MGEKYKKLLIIVIVSIIIALLIFGASSFLNKRILPQQTSAPVQKIDDRISPLTTQALTVEVQRIRNRGLMAKMLEPGISWRNPPQFYWIAIVDGKECNSSQIEAAGGVKGEWVFTTWDTICQEGRVNFFVPQEQPTSDVQLIIMERVHTGLLGRKTRDVAQEKITMTYDYRTGRWTGDDSFKDADGYGHYVGDAYELWFSLYQSDYDLDGIPYWTEVNVLHTDPMVDDSKLDPDNDGIPTSWEWKWGYDPFTWDDHRNLDPDIDGIENIEEYQMRDWFSDPYQPDIYIEADGMVKGRLLDWNHVFFEESQQMIIERFAEHGINVYIDAGWPDTPKNGGGEMLPFIETLDEVNGGLMLQFYRHNFPDERKGIFRYLIVANNAGFTTPCVFNHYDTIVIDTSLRKTYVKRLAFLPRYQRVVLAKGVLHELGHTLGLLPENFIGNDIYGPASVRYPSMPKDEYNQYLTQYHSVMNYNYIFSDRKLFDYSDGSNQAPYDQDDWGHLYLPTFETNAKTIEEPVDQTFEDMEIYFKDPQVNLSGWELNGSLSAQYRTALNQDVYCKNTNSTFWVFTKINMTYQPSTRTVRVYARPLITPFPTNAAPSLVLEGWINAAGELCFYHQV
jgi:hypothetical protein